MVTNDFLATGGDGFFDFERGTDVSYGGRLRDVFGGYVKEKSPLSPRTEGRIKVKGK